MTTRTCGLCRHWAKGYCERECPPWVWAAIENIPGTTACKKDDRQAVDCDCFWDTRTFLQKVKQP